MKYQRDEHRIHLIVYHLVWCPKRRKPVLTGKIAKDCQELMENKCKEYGWTILNFTIQPDHIHLFIRTFPTISAAKIVNECKGVTSRILRQRYKELLKLPSLWTGSYFASTAGNVSQEIIQHYIEAQKGI